MRFIGKLDAKIKELDGLHNQVNDVYSSGAVEGYTTQKLEVETVCVGSNMLNIFWIGKPRLIEIINEVSFSAVCLKCIWTFCLPLGIPQEWDCTSWLVQAGHQSVGAWKCLWNPLDIFHIEVPASSVCGTFGDNENFRSWDYKVKVPTKGTRFADAWIPGQDHPFAKGKSGSQTRSQVSGEGKAKGQSSCVSSGRWWESTTGPTPGDHQKTIGFGATHGSNLSVQLQWGGACSGIYLE